MELQGTARDPRMRFRVVCGVVARHADDGQAKKIWKALPETSESRRPLQSPAGDGDGTDRGDSGPAMASSPPVICRGTHARFPRRADNIWRKIVRTGPTASAHSEPKWMRAQPRANPRKRGRMTTGNEYENCTRRAIVKPFPPNLWRHERIVSFLATAWGE